MTLTEATAHAVAMVARYVEAWGEPWTPERVTEELQGMSVGEHGRGLDLDCRRDGIHVNGVRVPYVVIIRAMTTAQQMSLFDGR